MSDSLKVIYVDDEPDIRTIVEMSLSLDSSLDVRIADSGREALALIAGEWRPDIALLDMMMPEMSGKQLLDRLRAQPEFATLPIVFVTASARQSDIEHYLNQGADGVIIKPFDPLSLARTVRDEYARIAAGRP
jgi:two-component system, OmpR family, response regulator